MVVQSNYAMVRAMLELNSNFAESDMKGTLVKIAYSALEGEGMKDAQMIKLFVEHFMQQKKEQNLDD